MTRAGTSFYDPQGNSLSFESWCEMFESRSRGSKDWWCVGRDKVGSREVSTVWMGIDHNFAGQGPPIIFETMVFGDDEEQMGRYSTWEEAEAGHRRMVERLKRSATRRGARDSPRTP